MTKHIYKGWTKSWEELKDAPQPIGVMLGGNFRKNSKPQSPPPKAEPPQAKKDK